MNSEDSAKYWYNRGVDFSESGQYRESLESYDQALKFDDKDPDIWNNKCYVLTKMGKFEEAIKAGKKAVEHAPNDPRIWDCLSDAYSGNNNFTDAAECSRKKTTIENFSSRKKTESSFKDWIRVPNSPIFLISFILGLVSMIVAIRDNYINKDMALVVVILGTGASFIVLYSLRELLMRMFPLTSEKYQNSEKGNIQNESVPDSYLYYDRISEKELIITKDYIEFNKSHLNFNDFTGIRFGIFRHTINNIGSTHYTIHLTKESISRLLSNSYIPPASSITISIDYSEGELTPEHIAKKYQDRFKTITDLLFQLAVIPQAKKMIDEFYQKGSIKIGNLILNREGIGESSAFMIKWSNYKGYEFANGQIIIKNKADSFWKSIEFSLPLKDAWNAVCLNIILDNITKNPSPEFGTHAEKPTRGSDLLMHITIHPEEAVSGVERDIVVMHTKRCTDCNGSGKKEGLVCKPCRGTGRLRVKETASVKIPVGIGNGMRIRMKGYGESGASEETDGDLYIEVNIK